MSDRIAAVRQILVITDGFSNVGDDPVSVATRARKQNIAVNVIGVVDSGEMGVKGQSEALSIADAGGGMCRIVRPVELSATAQMLTHQTMQLTLQQVVNEQLQEVVGKRTDELAPIERTKVMQVVDRLEEEVRLDLVVCIDTSASMKEKMGMVREAVRDLALSLQAREGDSRVAVVSFPGRGEELAQTVQLFQPDVDMHRLEHVFAARGGTPTGPAIDAAIRLLAGAAKDPASMTDDGPRDDRAASL